MVEALGLRPILTSGGPAQLLYGKLATAMPETSVRPPIWEAVLNAWRLQPARARA